MNPCVVLLNWVNVMLSRVMLLVLLTSPNLIEQDRDANISQDSAFRTGFHAGGNTAQDVLFMNRAVT